MRLTKAQRATLREKFGGRCAYCGAQLGDRWHADHIESVQRKLEHVRGKGFVPTGEMYRPEHDHIGNLAPACAPCNIDKHAMSLEGWREKLARTLDVLQRNYPTYRHALRFGMLEEKPSPVIFYFERAASHDTKPLTRCAAGRDGECGHAQCPQLRDNEQCTTGRHCPLDNLNED